MRKIQTLGLSLVAVGIAASAGWPLHLAVEERQAEVKTTEAQERLRKEIPSAPKTTPRIPTARPVAPGEALVEVRIPRFGKSWEWVALEGTSDEVIANGPGHYEGTALPGGRGNSAFAAHRAGHGDPFIDFDLLTPGDLIHFTQGKVTWTYRVTTRPKIVEPSDVWVLDRFAPGRWLTLTTCWPKYGSAKRMYIRAKLEI